MSPQRSCHDQRPAPQVATTEILARLRYTHPGAQTRTTTTIVTWTRRKASTRAQEHHHTTIQRPQVWSTSLQRWYTLHDLHDVDWYTREHRETP